MASELTVQTIKGPSSGGNANKIIIPSGQTLDASAGLLTPSAGQIVQHVLVKPTTRTEFSSGTYATAAGFSLTITPKFANSKIVIRCFAKAYMHNSLGGNAANSGQQHRITRNGSAIYEASWQNYFNRNNMANDFYPPFVTEVIDEPASTSLLTYEIQGKKYATTQQNWSINDANGGTIAAIFEATEIKQ